MRDGPLIAVLGGGQLGRMLGLAGIPMHLRFRFLDPSPDACAAAVGELVVGALDDLDAVDATIKGADAVTYEWEGVPAATIEHVVAQGGRVAPNARALAASQDRLHEKELFRSLGIATAPYATVDSRDDLERAVATVGVPAILKTRRGGYDGKGQVRLAADADVERAWRELGGVPLLLEGNVAFQRELSVLACRARDGSTVCWPLGENTHRNGILAHTLAPAPSLAPATQQAGEALVRALLDALDYVGVVCIELFDVHGELVANEFAPRVHNSGHYTIEGAQTSQFENHLRALLDLPLGSTAPRGPSAMLNCIGALPDPAAVLAVPGAHLHDYAKEPRAGRKV
ncbi:MAG TPA: 5-(carboxyamino)imidazole ribonucleotide synthase, partial [Acidimicrobiia bacterium]